MLPAFEAFDIFFEWLSISDEIPSKHESSGGTDEELDDFKDELLEDLEEATEEEDFDVLLFFFG